MNKEKPGQPGKAIAETDLKAKKPSEMTLEEFNNLLNQEPLNVQTNDGYKHIPIAFLEADLRYCFEGRVEFHKTPNQQLFNAVDCDVIIKVFHPVLKEHQLFFGTGTVMIERITQGKYADTTKVVKETDESIATHSAFAEGKKSAAKGIGQRFGSNLNRENKPSAKSRFDNPEDEINTFDPAKKYSKSKLLQMVAGGIITEEQRSDYIKNN